MARSPELRAQRDARSIRRSSVHALALFGCFACFACAEDEDAAPLDTPPFLVDFDPEIAVNLADRAEIQFSVDSVRSLDGPEEIAYAFEFYLSVDDSSAVTLGAGTLQPFAADSAGIGTVYAGPSLTLDSCTTPLVGDDGDLTTVTLLLIDPIPPEEHAAIGLTEHVVRATWRVRLSGSCPDR